jgi:hypothetical protein
LTELPNKLALLAAFLVALLVMGGGAPPAAAHATHAHGATTAPSPDHRQPGGSLGAQSHVVEAHATSPDLPYRVPDPSRDSDCCCGSAVCHAAGVTLAVTVLVLPEPKGARVKAEPSFGPERRAPSGLERPPRTLRAV